MVDVVTTARHTTTTPRNRCANDIPEDGRDRVCTIRDAFMAVTWPGVVAVRCGRTEQGAAFHQE
jgi:hypothetical protein